MAKLMMRQSTSYASTMPIGSEVLGRETAADWFCVTRIIGDHARLDRFYFHSGQWEVIAKLEGLFALKGRCLWHSAKEGHAYLKPEEFVLLSAALASAYYRTDLPGFLLAVEDKLTTLGLVLLHSSSPLARI